MIHNFIPVGPEGLPPDVQRIADATFVRGFVKVHVTMDGKFGGEYLWAKRERNGFRIDNLPFSDGVPFAFGALVRAHPDPVGQERTFEFDAVVEPGSWLRFSFGTAASNGSPVLRELMSSHPEGKKFRYEAMHTNTFVGVAKGKVNLTAVEASLDRLFDEGRVEFWWDGDGQGQIREGLIKELGIEE